MLGKRTSDVVERGTDGKFGEVEHNGLILPSRPADACIRAARIRAEDHRDRAGARAADLGYTFVFVAAVDMTAVAGTIGGGLGDFAITYGYQRFEWGSTGVAVLIISVLVQAAQRLGNLLYRKALRS